MPSTRIRSFGAGIALVIAPVLAQSGSLTLAHPLADTATDEDIPLVVSVRDVFTDPESLAVTYTAKVETGTGYARIEGVSPLNGDIVIFRTFCVNKVSMRRPPSIARPRARPPGE